MQTPGILNRAGYYRKIDPTDGQQKIYWAGNITGTKDDTLINKKWLERRNRYAKEANIDTSKMTEAGWQEWAELQFQTHERAKTIKLQAGIKTLDGKKTDFGFQLFNRQKEFLEVRGIAIIVEEQSAEATKERRAINQGFFHATNGRSQLGVGSARVVPGIVQKGDFWIDPKSNLQV